MSAVTTDRWSCPSCGRTVIVVASPQDTAVCIHAAQIRHARGHRAAARITDNRIRTEEEK